ncbi:GNAT family N-acetyltransferase [Halalkalibacillus sediminis]|uniref:GNAT family N-acetyltransferase n=1 Tax=Halalkalibacillus sediminis TaxID=2018042 RepID=A0A2I0QRT0_9BACI|nr:GNAT family N-acetyltransferase [Halalkalibacillus sediminis]PKR77031.1 GNAT family N-acetyltransferase [Halalkalibacillus sediminis]
MIRAATRTDLQAIGEMIERVKLKMKQEGIEQWDEHYPTVKHYEEDLHNGRLYVFDSDGSIRGVICISDQGHHEYEEIPWTYDEPYYCLKRLAVDPLAQNEGIGHQFYQFAEKVAMDNGVYYICTDTNEHNPSAQKLFIKSGYNLVQTAAIGGHETNYCYYEKKLNP